MEDNKYYTPSIEEFHIGFEYVLKQEDKNCNEYWEKNIAQENVGVVINELIKGGCIKVKHLDKEDIESLGWKQQHILDIWKEDSEFESGFRFKITNLIDINIIYDYNTHLMKIYKATVYDEISGNWNEEILFVGTIKNKSEFKKLMKQLNIQNE